MYIRVIFGYPKIILRTQILEHINIETTSLWSGFFCEVECSSRIIFEYYTYNSNYTFTNVYLLHKPIKRIKPTKNTHKITTISYI